MVRKVESIMKTTLPKESEIQRKWYVVDAAGKPLGRLAVKVANLLRGRGKPIFTPHIDTGDFVVITNARDVKMTGTKPEKKVYVRFTGYRSGKKTTSFEMMHDRHPERVVQKAVKGMLPHNELSRSIIRRLKVYPGAEHPHAAQSPKSIELA
jgi:large subunit ribosomal protein L13